MATREAPDPGIEDVPRSRAPAGRSTVIPPAARVTISSGLVGVENGPAARPRGAGPAAKVLRVKVPPASLNSTCAGAAGMNRGHCARPALFGSPCRMKFTQ